MSDDDNDDECPLCCAEFDATDKRFRPCQCGYRVCIFCWNKMREQAELERARCPNCREAYADEPVFLDPDPDIAKKRSQQEPKKPKVKQPKKGDLKSRKALAEFRVVQKNLVYVINLSPIVAREDILRSHNLFGQYGRLQKVIINKANLTNGGASKSAGPLTASAYLTYQGDDEAAACIRCADGAWLDGKMLRAFFGTTKYCAQFINGLTCTNPECMYLHDVANDCEHCTKEDMQQRQQLAPVAKPKPRATTKGLRLPSVASVPISSVPVHAISPYTVQAILAAAVATTSIVPAAPVTPQTPATPCPIIPVLEPLPASANGASKPVVPKSTSKVGSSLNRNDSTLSASRSLILSSLPATTNWATKGGSLCDLTGMSDGSTSPGPADPTDDKSAGGDGKKSRAQKRREKKQTTDTLASERGSSAANSTTSSGPDARTSRRQRLNQQHGEGDDASYVPSHARSNSTSTQGSLTSDTNTTNTTTGHTGRAEFDRDDDVDDYEEDEEEVEYVDEEDGYCLDSTVHNPGSTKDTLSIRDLLSLAGVPRTANEPVVSGLIPSPIPQILPSSSGISPDPRAFLFGASMSIPPSLADQSPHDSRTSMVRPIPTSSSPSTTSTSTTTLLGILTDRSGEVTNSSASSGQHSAAYNTIASSTDLPDHNSGSFPNSSASPPSSNSYLPAPNGGKGLMPPVPLERRETSRFKFAQQMSQFQHDALLPSSNTQQNQSQLASLFMHPSSSTSSEASSSTEIGGKLDLLRSMLPNTATVRMSSKSFSSAPSTDNSSFASSSMQETGGVSAGGELSWGSLNLGLARSSLSSGGNAAMAPPPMVGLGSTWSVWSLSQEEHSKLDWDGQADAAPIPPITLTDDGASHVPANGSTDLTGDDDEPADDMDPAVNSDNGLSKTQKASHDLSSQPQQRQIISKNASSATSRYTPKTKTVSPPPPSPDASQSKPTSPTQRSNKPLPPPPPPPPSHHYASPHYGPAGRGSPPYAPHHYTPGPSSHYNTPPPLPAGGYGPPPYGYHPRHPPPRGPSGPQYYPTQQGAPYQPHYKVGKR